MRHGLGRLAASDARDAAFPLRTLLPPAPPAVKSRFFHTGPVLDQGQSPECVAYAWKQWLDSSPITAKPAQPPTPEWIYHAAQAVDEWAGTPHDGTSVRAGAKVIEGLKRLGAYHWSTSADDARLYLLTMGTLVIGINWYEAMFDPEADGTLQVSGSLAGGHALLLNGFSDSRQAFRGINSWGPDWGQNGRFWLRKADLARLLSEDGEACAGVEIKVLPGQTQASSV
jgi:hypothetical protein